MTVHVLHAGDGYTYLTRQVASADQQRARGEDLAEYYTAEGNPPGRWMGSGMAALEVSGEVSEAQMRALFGEGLHPDAERIIAERAELYVRAGDTVAKAAAAAHRDARLGRRFPQFAPGDGDWHEQLRAAYTAEATRLGRSSSAALTDEEREQVHGRVAQAGFAERHGRAPTDEAELRAYVAERARRPRQPVAGYDLVFTPVKSVSVLWALGDDRVRGEVRAAHEAAVTRALGHVERHAARTRTGAGGVAQVDTDGLIIAAFEHRDSRSGDPNLHTHCAVSTKVRGRDGRWRSLDGRVLFALGVSASETYNTAVEDELRARLGVTFVERAGGLAGKRPVREIEGVPAGLLRRFSRRRAVIEEVYRAKLGAYRAAYGHEPDRGVQARLAQEATLESRQDKAPMRSLAEQRREWMAAAADELGDAGVDVATWISNAVLTAEPGVGEGSLVDVDVDAAAAAVVGTVQEERATWTRWHLHAEAERQLRGVTVDPGHRGQLVDAVTLAARDRHSVTLTAPPTEHARPRLLQREDGESVFRVHGAQRYSSHAVLAAEQRLVAAAGREAPSPVSPAVFARAVRLAQAESGRPLDAGQVALAEAFATGGRRLGVGIGPAGTGKTTSMRLLVDAAALAGSRVVALAPSAKAAEVLATELDVPADTLHKLLHTLTTQGEDAVDVRAGDIVLVDEAGMAGTLRLDRLVDLAERRGAVVRLLGDPQQLAAVESGGALRLLDQEVGAARLSQVHRFLDPAEAAASLQLRDGNPAALDHYESAGRVHGGSLDACLDAVFEAWSADTRAGHVAVMMSGRGDVVTDLSARARLARIAAGDVDDTGAAAQLHDGNRAAVGDRVVTRVNDRRTTARGGRDFVKNGDVWDVAAVGEDGSLDVVHTGHQGRVTLAAGYVADSVELAYASTVHRAQGMTVDIAHALVDDTTTRESLYVAATRGRSGNHLYAVSEPVLDPDLDRAPGPESSAREVLERALAREGAERSATETGRDALEDATSLARLVPEYDHARGLDVDQRLGLRAAALAGLGADDGQRVLADPAWPALAAAVAERHAGDPTGPDPAQLLRAAAAQRETGTADSLAQVLTWRLRDRATERRVADHADAAGLPSWVVAPDPARSDDTGTWLQERARTIRDRVDALEDRARRQPPAWLPGLPGLPGPSVDAGGAPSRRALRAVLAYRDQFAVTDPTSSLGPRPTGRGHQQRAWDAAQAATRPTRAVAATRPAATHRLPAPSRTPAAAPPAYRADEPRGPQA
ncbi:MobF family relaxase [Jannaschia sp. R86511]|uniref:MobF family relaxase n=1 Tax=Jannaschia sp. R86511 TaxID=3093853 RepID=UPI0036D2844C